MQSYIELKSKKYESFDGLISSAIAPSKDRIDFNGYEIDSDEKLEKVVILYEILF